MKYNYIHITRLITAIIAIILIISCQSTNAQPGYRYAPRMQVPYYRSVIVPNPPAQNYGQGYNQYNYRQGYNQYNQMGGVQPLISFSIHFDPLISWFSTDSYDTHSNGVVPGFNFGITHNSYFSPNYSFYSGMDIIKAGGTLINRETTSFELKNYSSSIFTVQPGEAITYRITYLSIPLGIKLQSNQIGYGRFFTDFGFAPEILLGSRADIPSLNISGGNASRELNLFNLSFHVMAGMEYPLAGNNSFIFGIGYDNNLFDITRDNGDQPTNVVTQRMVSIRLGMTF